MKSAGALLVALAFVLVQAEHLPSFDSLPAAVDVQELERAAGGPFDIILTPACALPAYTHGASKRARGTRHAIWGAGG